jgi:quinol monooxygenase YgiN
MIIIAGTIDLTDASRRDEALQLAAVLQKKTREEEAGCHAYVFSADPCVTGRPCVYELGQDEASLAAHFEHVDYRSMREALGRLGLKRADNSKYRVDLREPVYDPTFTPRRGRWQVLEFLQGLGGGGNQNVARYRDDNVRCADGCWRFARRELLVTCLGPADLNDPQRG